MSEKTKKQLRFAVETHRRNCFMAEHCVGEEVEPECAPVEWKQGKIDWICAPCVEYSRWESRVRASVVEAE